MDVLKNKKQIMGIKLKHSSSIKFKIILLFFILNLSTKIYSQKYKVTYSGSLSTDYCDPDPFISGSASSRISLGSTLFLEAKCGEPTDIVNATKEIKFKPDKIIAIVRFKGRNATNTTIHTDIIPLNLKQCDSWTGSYDLFPTTAGDGMGDFSFTIEPVIALIQPNPSPSCTVHISADNLGFSSDIYNWWYTASDNVEKLLPSAFQGLSNFDITLEDIFVQDAPQYYNQNIKFKIKYCQTETKPIIFNFVSCSPQLDPLIPPHPEDQSCSNKEDGQVTFYFNRPLEKGETYLFSRTLINPDGTDGPITSTGSDIDAIKMTTPLSYTWKDIKQGKYKFFYQTYLNGNLRSKVDGINPFKIGSPVALKSTFEIPKNPLCHDGNGSVTIVANGGTAPYYYILDNATENINGQDVPKKTSISVPIQGLTEGNHNIKVVDSNDCIQTQE
jgi:hypothetical protein